MSGKKTKPNSQDPPPSRKEHTSPFGKVHGDPSNAQGSNTANNARKPANTTFHRRSTAPVHGQGVSVKRNSSKQSSSKMNRHSSLGVSLNQGMDYKKKRDEDIQKNNTAKRLSRSTSRGKVRRSRSTSKGKVDRGRSTSRGRVKEASRSRSVPRRSRSATPQPKKQQEQSQHNSGQDQQPKPKQKQALQTEEPQAGGNKMKRKTSLFANKFTRPLAGIGGKVGGILHHGKSNHENNHENNETENITEIPMKTTSAGDEDAVAAKPRISRVNSSPHFHKKSIQASNTHTLNAHDLDVLRQNLGEFTVDEKFDQQKSQFRRRRSRSLEPTNEPKVAKRSSTPSGSIPRARSGSSDTLDYSSERERRESRVKSQIPPNKQSMQRSSSNRHVNKTERKSSVSTDPRHPRREKSNHDLPKHQQQQNLDRRKQSKPRSKSSQKPDVKQSSKEPQRESRHEKEKDPKISKRERIHKPKPEPQEPQHHHPRHHRSKSAPHEKEEKAVKNDSNVDSSGAPPPPRDPPVAATKPGSKDLDRIERTRKTRDDIKSKKMSGRSNPKADNTTRVKKGNTSYAVKSTATRRSKSCAPSSSGVEKDEDVDTKNKRQQHRNNKSEGQEAGEKLKEQRMKGRRRRSLNFGERALVPFATKTDSENNSEDEWYEDLYNLNSPVHSLSPERSTENPRFDDGNFDDDDGTYRTSLSARDYENEDFSASFVEGDRKGCSKYDRPEPVKSFYESNGGDADGDGSLAGTINLDIFGRSNSPELRRNSSRDVVDEAEADKTDEDEGSQPPVPIRSFYEPTVFETVEESNEQNNSPPEQVARSDSPEEIKDNSEGSDYESPDNSRSEEAEDGEVSVENADDGDDFDETIDVMSETSLPESLVGSSNVKDETSKIEDSDSDHIPETDDESIGPDLMEKVKSSIENVISDQNSNGGSDIDGGIEEQSLNSLTEEAPSAQSTYSGATKHPASDNPGVETATIDSGATKHPPPESDSLTRDAQSTDSGLTKHPPSGDEANSIPVAFPPMHSKIRSMKPRPSQILLSNKNHAKQPSWQHSVMVEESVKANTITIDAGASTGMSEITTPSVLLRAPPLHSTIRSRKPATGLGKGLHKLNAEDDDSAPEIDLHTLHTNMSEITMPTAILKSRHHAPPSRFRTTTRKEEKKVGAASARIKGRLRQLSEENTPEVTDPSNPEPTPPPPRRHLPPPPPARSAIDPKSDERNAVPDSFEELAASYCTLPDSANNGQFNTIDETQESIPMKPPSERGMKGTKEPDAKSRRSSVMSDSMQELTDAAAQLLSVQSGGRGSGRLLRNNSAPPLSSSPPKSTDMGTNIKTNTTRNNSMQNHRRQKSGRVENMSFTDGNGDFGFYTGETDEFGRPHGKGSIKQENGVFYSGSWTNGVQESNDSRQRERILSGFTSWKGAQTGKKGSVGQKVYGMAWIDRMGCSGKYSGVVNADMVPDGFGVMRYDFGLVAEGEWVKGMLAGGGPASGMPPGSFGGPFAYGRPVVMSPTMTNAGGANVFPGYLHPQNNNFRGGQN